MRGINLPRNLMKAKVVKKIFSRYLLQSSEPSTPLILNICVMVVPKMCVFWIRI